MNYSHAAYVDYFPLASSPDETATTTFNPLHAQPEVPTSPAGTRSFGNCTQTCLTERQNCLLFVKVLFRYLAPVKPLQKRVKLVVAKCIRRSQQDKSLSLVDMLELELRACIGEIHWSRAQKYYSDFCVKQGLQSTCATQIEAV